MHIKHALFPGGYGNLGKTGLGGNLDALISAGYGQGLRSLLDANFGPGKTIDIAGIHIFGTTGAIGTPTIGSFLTPSVLGNIDIIFLHYGFDVTETEAQNIVDWLDASPHRVLMYNRCAISMLPTLVDKLGNDDWVDTNSTNTFSFVKENENNNYFTTSGPFGAVLSAQKDISQPASYSSMDIYWMALPTNSSNYKTPLLLTSNNCAVISVDQDRHIVHTGDANLLGHNNGYDNVALTNNGSISTGVAGDHERLWGNIFAWAIEQVILPGIK